MHDRARERACRILLVALPTLLADVLAAAIGSAADLELIGTADDPIAALVLAGQAVDVVIIGTDRAAMPPPLASQLFGEYPAIRILAILLADGRATGHWLAPRSREFGAVSPAQLLAAARTLHQLEPLD